MVIIQLIQNTVDETPTTNKYYLNLYSFSFSISPLKYKNVNMGGIIK